MTSCNLCPRKCGADRKENIPAGFCASPSLASVTRAAPHFGEEPCISGERGSGTVFFSGCNLRCVFCQNHEISRGQKGQMLDANGLRELFLRLRDEGVHNINLVTPTHYTDIIAEALSGIKLGIPVVWNSSGYESVDSLRKLNGLVQVYMPDYKYSDPRLAKKWSMAEDYPHVALAAIKEMYRQRGEFVLDDEGMLQSGVLIRHLIMPGHCENTLRCIDAIEDNLPADKIIFSLMAQYTPMPNLESCGELNRPITMEEYERCRSYFDFSDIIYGFTQSPEAATEEMIPDFDGTGLK